MTIHATPSKGTSASTSESRSTIRFFSEGPEVRPISRKQISRIGSGVHVVQDSSLNSGALVAPIADFLQPFGASLFEQSDPVAGVLEFMNIGPNFSLPGLVVN